MNPEDPSSEFLFSTELVDYQSSEGRRHRNHRHPQFFQLTFVTAGEGLHYVGDAAPPLVPGGLYLVAPQTAHACSGRGLRGRLCHFSPDLLSYELRLRLHQTYYFTRFPAESWPLITGLFDHLAKPASPSLVKTLLQSLLTLLLESGYAEAGPMVEKSNHHLAQGFLALARVHYATERRVSWYAAQLHCSTNHLGTCVRAQIQRPPGQYLRELALEDARNRLLQETTTVSTIADELGFRDVDYFWRFFKKHVGVTPLDYRNGQKDPRKVQTGAT